MPYPYYLIVKFYIEAKRYRSKIIDFILPHLHLAFPLEVTMEILARHLASENYNRCASDKVVFIDHKLVTHDGLTDKRLNSLTVKWVL